MLARGAVVSLSDLNQPFVVKTDASCVGIAEGLQQVSFISRVLTDSKSNYTVQEWECLVVAWVVYKFRPCFDFTDFKVHCDHSSLSWMFTTEQTSPQVRRWLPRLQGFNCTIRRRRGRENIPADALSRAPIYLTETAASSLSKTLFPIAALDGDLIITFEAAPTALPIGAVGELRDKGKLAGEHMLDSTLAALETVVHGDRLPYDATNARLLHDLAETTELDADGALMERLYS